MHKVPALHYDISRKLMDLGIIKKRLKNRYYKDVNQLVNDIWLLINTCKFFNSNNSAVLQMCKQLDKRFHKVIANMPTVEEIPYHKKESDSSMERKQWKQKVQKLQSCAEQLEPEACEFFQEKWMDLRHKLHKRQLKSLETLDAHVNGFLNHCNNQSKHIYELFKKDLEEYGYESDAYALTASSSMWQCGPTKFKWQDCLVDAIDDINASLNQSLFTCCSKQQADEEQDKQAVVENDAADGNEKQSYSDALLQMFVHAQIINEGLCGQTNLADSSDDENMPVQSNYVDKEERLAIQKQFDQLPPVSMYEIMHLIEQAEHDSESNCDRKYNVMYFSQDTINLIKIAIDRATLEQNKANLGYMNSVEKDGNCPNLSGPSAYNMSSYYQYPYPTSNTLSQNYRDIYMDEQYNMECDDATMESYDDG